MEPTSPDDPADISCVVFDFGGVLISPITTLIEEIASWHGVSMVEMLDVLMGPREVSTDDHPWHRCERGELPTAMLQAEVEPYAQRAGLRLRGDEYERLLRGDFVVHDEVVERIVALRGRGYRVGLLTNSFKEFRELIEARVDFSLFDLVVDSSEVGCRKPEAEIYELTSARLGVDRSAILYLDDFRANIDGARRAGWATIEFTDPASALDELDRRLAIGR